MYMCIYLGYPIFQTHWGKEFMQLQHETIQGNVHQSARRGRPSAVLTVDI